jgi:hypothetical protein
MDSSVSPRDEICSCAITFQTRSTAIHILDLGARTRVEGREEEEEEKEEEKEEEEEKVVVNAKLRKLYPLEGDPVPIAREAE